jgi:hypothetical protein
MNLSSDAALALPDGVLTTINPLSILKRRAHVAFQARRDSQADALFVRARDTLAVPPREFPQTNVACGRFARWVI